MAKNKIEGIVSELVVDLSPEAMQVMEGKGKKAALNEEKTFANIIMNLSYYRGLLDAYDSISDQVSGLDAVVQPHKEAFDVLYAYAEENHEEDFAEFVEQFGIESFGTASDEEEEDGEDEDSAFAYVANLELADVKAIAKALEIKVVKKDTVESLVAKFEEEVEEDALVETLTDLGYYEDEVVEEEGPDYTSMSLGDLRKLCKENGIKYTPKQKTDELIALLEANDEEEESDEDEVEEDEGDEEVDYTAFSLAELRAECKERGIAYTPKQKSVELIALLVADDKAEDEGEEEDEEEESGNEYEELSLGDLRKLCKERGIKYTPKDKADELVEKLTEADEAEGEEDEPEEEEEEDVVDYTSMPLGDLRKLCKERGIKYTPKDKVDDLAGKLAESDEEEEGEEEDDEEVDEHELDEILDEEFEDEVMKSEVSQTSGKKGAGGKKGKR